MDHYLSWECCLIEQRSMVNRGIAALAEPSLGLYVDLGCGVGPVGPSLPLPKCRVFDGFCASCVSLLAR
jgi:hypothetical protein